MNKRITIREIAELSNTSVSTVSRVINHSGYVSEEKLKKIKKIIKDKGYFPSEIARTLGSNKTHTIAIMLPDISNPYFINLINQISITCNQNNYQVILVNTESAGQYKSSSSVTNEIKAFQNILARQVDGVIIIGGEIDRTKLNTDYIKELNLLNNQIPVVAIAQKNNFCKCTFVPRHIEKGMELIMQHMLALGHRKIAFLGGQKEIRISEERLKYYKKFMNLYGAQYSDDSILMNNFYISDGYDGIQKLLQKSSFDAILAINDQVAQGAVRWLYEHNKLVPDYIAIGSCDMTPNSKYLVPAITTVNQHEKSLGDAAVSVLLDKIDGKSAPDIKTELPELMIRESCGERVHFYANK